jgi:hypothetical protein
MVRLNVNGTERSLGVAPNVTSLWAHRNVLDLTGTKLGCGIEQSEPVPSTSTGLRSSFACLRLTRLALVGLPQLSIAPAPAGGKLQLACLEQRSPRHIPMPRLSRLPTTLSSALAPDDRS